MSSGHSAARRRLVASLAFVVALAAPALSRGSTLDLPQASIKAEKKIRRWLKSDSAVRRIVARLQTQESGAASAAYSLPPALADRDLKDAVADAPAPSAKDGGAGWRRAPDAPLGCADFPSCRSPILEMETQPGQKLEPAVLAMLRPWLWLAEFRGRHLVLTPVREDAETELFLLTIPGFDMADVRVNAEARPGGGVHLWLDRGLELGETYSRQRGYLDPVTAPL
ncbi:MAG: hypothetical protein ACHQ49_15115 [Elusimicrobiota bacterium]